MKKAVAFLSAILLLAVYAVIAVNIEYKLEISDVKDSTIDFINRGRKQQAYKLS